MPTDPDCRRWRFCRVTIPLRWRGKLSKNSGEYSASSRGREVVLVKPNIGWDRTPEQAANTNPDVVAEVIRQCLGAGAKRVLVTDVSCNEPRRCFQRSGIAEAAKQAGAEVILPDPSNFKEVDLQGEVLHAWPVFESFLNADKIINVPIAKHHGLTGTTLGMKNWYGILGRAAQSVAPENSRESGRPRRLCASDSDPYRLLQDSAAKWANRRQSGRRVAQENVARVDGSSRSRRICSESLLGHRS